MTWREEWEEAKKLTGEEFYAKYGRYKWNNSYYERLDESERMLNGMKFPETKLSITLPQFGSWEDLYYHISDKYIACDNLSAFLEIMKHEYPHGIRIGDKYIQK